MLTVGWKRLLSKTKVQKNVLIYSATIYLPVYSFFAVVSIPECFWLFCTCIMYIAYDLNCAILYQLYRAQEQNFVCDMGKANKK